MITRSTVGALVLGALVATAALSGTPQQPRKGLAELGDVPLLTLDGEQVGLGDLAGDSLLVLAYTGVGCPIAGKYAPRLQELSEAYGKRGVSFLGINANAQDSREKIAQETGELGIGFPVLKDFRQELTRRLEAKTTTEVFVFDAAGALRYRGAVDDQYALGAGKPAPTANYLVEALEALLVGRAPAKESTEAPGCLITRVPEEELRETVTWSRDVSRILQKRCVKCHRPGQVAPFPLETYEQAKGWAEMMASVIEEGRMPPWNADERFKGVFANERRLTAKERAKVLKWVDEDMPRGNPDEDPPLLEWPPDWRIGEPDVVFEMEEFRGGRPLPEAGFEVPREGVVDYIYFTAQTDYPEDRWVQAIEVRAGAPDVVHHVLILLEDPKSGQSTDFRSYLAVAVPGDTPSVYPDGYGKRLPAGARLVFQLHYTPNGKQRFDRSSMAMIFCDEPPIFEVVTDSVINQRFRIPAGAENYEVRGERTITEDTGLLAYFPHMHTRGKDFKYVAHYPDGSSEELLFSHYDFNWQESYILPDPKPMFAGTRIECIGHFDNSDKNPNNPDPTATVSWGDQTFEEMFIGYFDTVRPLD